jgi:hypothetical protein
LSDETNRRRFLVTVLAYRGHLRAALEAEAGRQLIELEELALVPAPPDPVILRLNATDPMSLAGLEWARARGDRATLRRIAGGTGRPTAALTAEQRYLVATARGYLALLMGDSATGIRFLASAPDSGCDCRVHRLHLARVLLARGDIDSAKRLLSREMGKLFRGPLSQVLWELERGRLAEREGRLDGARRSYQFVRDVWRRADPELREFVAVAEAGLQRLGAPTSPSPSQP